MHFIMQKRTIMEHVAVTVPLCVVCALELTFSVWIYPHHVNIAMQNR